MKLVAAIAALLWKIKCKIFLNTSLRSGHCSRFNSFKP